MMQMTELLLSRGANPTLTDKHGNTPKNLAEKKGENEIAAMLEARTNIMSKGSSKQAPTRRSIKPPGSSFDA